MNSTNVLRLFCIVFSTLVLYVDAVSASSYIPLVQRGTSDYKTKFEPSSSSLAIDVGGVIIPSVVGESYELQRRVFIPPGTKSLQMTLYTFASPPETKVLMRFASPPTGTILNVTPNTAAAVEITKVLSQITANGGGVELPFYSPESAGSVKLSSRSGDLVQTIQTNVGGWLYINVLQVPGNRVYELNTSVTVDEVCYRSWYVNAKWDISGNPDEAATHTCAGSTGGLGAVTTPLLKSIQLTPPILTTQGSTSVISAGTDSTGASLGQCSSASNVVSIDASNKITLNNTVTVVTQIPVTCGGITTNITIQPPVDLKTITLENPKNQTIVSLVNNDAKNISPTIITVKPNPGAVLPQPISPNVSGCVAKYNEIESSNIKWITQSTFQLSQDAQLLGKDKIVSIDCGATAKIDFTIKMPLVAKSPIGNALEFNFLPSGTATTADLYIAGYIKDILLNKLTGKVESAWICRSNDDSNWVYMPGAILPRICKRSGIKVNDKVRIAIDTADIAGIGSSSVSEYFFTFSEKTLKDAKVELYGAYTTDNGNSFNFIGDDNTGTFSAQPPVGANINALYIFK